MVKNGLNDLVNNSHLKYQINYVMTRLQVLSSRKNMIHAAGWTDQAVIPGASCKNHA